MEPYSVGQPWKKPFYDACRVSHDGCFLIIDVNDPQKNQYGPNDDFFRDLDETSEIIRSAAEKDGFPDLPVVYARTNSGRTGPGLGKWYDGENCFVPVYGFGYSQVICWMNVTGLSEDEQEMVLKAYDRGLTDIRKDITADEYRQCLLKNGLYAENFVFRIRTKLSDMIPGSGKKTAEKGGLEYDRLFLENNGFDDVYTDGLRLTMIVNHRRIPAVYGKVQAAGDEDPETGDPDTDDPDTGNPNRPDEKTLSGYAESIRGDRICDLMKDCEQKYSGDSGVFCYMEHSENCLFIYVTDPEKKYGRKFSRTIDKMAEAIGSDAEAAGIPDIPIVFIRTKTPCISFEYPPDRI